MTTYIINTDATSNNGRSYHDDWLERGIAVTSGPEKFHLKLGRLDRGDTVLMYVNNLGIVGAGTVEDDAPVIVKDGMISPREPVEYHRRVKWYADFRKQPIRIGEIRRAWGTNPSQTVQRVLKNEVQLLALIEQRRSKA